MQKLSKTQQQVLDWLREPGNSALYMRYMGRFNLSPYWFDRNHMRHIRDSTMRRLEKLGLVRIKRRDAYDNHTEAFAVRDAPERAG